jgi:AraC-like DNA-binding protein
VHLHRSAFDAGSDGLHPSNPSDDSERQLRPVLRYIDAHLGEPLDNARLAAFVHASESHFIRLFRRVIGCTPARHVQERRVRHAAELLARTNLTIDDRGALRREPVSLLARLRAANGRAARALPGADAAPEPKPGRQGERLRRNRSGISARVHGVGHVGPLPPHGRPGSGLEWTQIERRSA